MLLALHFVGSSKLSPDALEEKQLEVREGAMDWRDYITVDPAVCRGKACMKARRMMVSAPLDNQAAGAQIRTA